MSRKLTDESDWSKIVGSLDEWDKKNIQALVDTFYKTTFTIPIDDEGKKVIKLTGAEWVKQGLQEARKRHQIDGVLKGNKYGVKNHDMEMRVITSIPKPLHMKLMQGYPTILKDKKQLMWFAKNFPMFKVPKEL